MIKLKDLLNEDELSDRAAILKITNAKLKQLGYNPINKLGTWGSNDYSSYNVKVPSSLKSIVDRIKIRIKTQYDSSYDHRYNPNPGIILYIDIFQFPVAALGGSNVGYHIITQYTLKDKKWSKLDFERD